MILYALLCGALPFDDDDDDVMKSKILKGDFEIPEVLSEGMSCILNRLSIIPAYADTTILPIYAHLEQRRKISSKAFCSKIQARDLRSKRFFLMPGSPK